MIKFYINRIEKGLITIEDVPKYWRAGVEAEFKKESEVNEENGR